MRKLLLLLIAVVAMGKLGHAQTGQACGPGAGDCLPGFVCDGDYCHDLNSDPYNCGYSGNQCLVTQDCINGKCCDGVDDPNCEPLITAQRPPKLVTFLPKSKHNAVTRALALLVRKD